MGQQSNKIIKRRRRADYLKRKQEQLKLDGLLPKAKVKTAKAVSTPADTEAPAKKAVAKKAPAKKVAKKAPAKKVEATETEEA